MSDISGTPRTAVAPVATTPQSDPVPTPSDGLLDRQADALTAGGWQRIDRGIGEVHWFPPATDPAPAEYWSTRGAYTRHVALVRAMAGVEAYYCPACNGWWSDRPGEPLRPTAGTRCSALCTTHDHDSPPEETNL